ncbi:unnamed protein product [[Candida] boidinii]|nr:unnamed protein product [[Candida] boidinii]
MDEDRVDGSIVVEFFEGVLFNSGNGGEVDEEEFKCEFEFEFKFWNFNSFVGVMLLRLLVDEVVKGSIESFSLLVEFDESSFLTVFVLVVFDTVIAVAVSVAAVAAVAAADAAAMADLVDPGFLPLFFFTGMVTSGGCIVVVSLFSIFLLVSVVLVESVESDVFVLFNFSI